MNITDFRDTQSGPVALLGNGPTLGTWVESLKSKLAPTVLERVEIGPPRLGVNVDGKFAVSVVLTGFTKQLPLIGINRSWKLIETPWRCYVDEAHHDDIRLGRAPAPEMAFSVRDPNRLEVPCPSVVVPWTPVTQETPKQRFCGAELDVGSFGPFAGYFALELARWMGFNPIYLFGYDGDGGHFDELDFERPELETRTWNGLFREARECLDRDGVRVINCSPASAIDAFERLES